jgi:glycosyltransferase involved in cell wall biosynthesis
MHDRDAPYRIGFFSNHATVVGGGEISFIDLVDSLRRHGVTPRVFVPGKGEVFDRLCARNLHPCIYALPPIRLSTLPRLFYAFIMMMVIILRNKLQIVHVNGARCMLLVGAASLVCRIPVVWHVRVMERDRHLDRIRAALASAIIANSKAVAQTIKPFCNDSLHIHVVYNGIDSSRFTSVAPIDVQREFSAPSSLPIVLAVGRLCAWKRFHVLIEACGILKNTAPAFTCLIIGRDAEDETRYTQDLRTMPKRLGLDNVIFGDWRTDVPSIMKSATLLALPSHYEPFGRVIIEAWACGLPVIATDAGGPAEIIEHGKTGMLIPIDDAIALAREIERLLTDGNLRDFLSSNGRARVNDFSLDAHAGNIAAIYPTMPRLRRTDTHA